MSDRYGIWMTMQHWSTIDGGPDDVGTREEMEVKAVEYTRKLHPGQFIKYEVRPYTGNDPHESKDDFLKRFGEYQANRDRDAEWKSYIEHTALRLVDRDGKNVLEQPLTSFDDWPRDLSHRTVMYLDQHYRCTAICPAGIVKGSTHRHSHEIVCNEITDKDPLRDYEREAGSVTVQRR